MNNTIQYKGYVGSIEFSEEDGTFYGKVLGIRSLISYEGSNAEELVNDFHESVDDYLLLCKEEKKTPEIAYKGSFNVRISPELHKQLAMYAINKGVSLNNFIEDILKTSAVIESLYDSCEIISPKHSLSIFDECFFFAPQIPENLTVPQKGGKRLI